MPPRPKKELDPRLETANEAVTSVTSLEWKETVEPQTVEEAWNLQDIPADKAIQILMKEVMVLKRNFKQMFGTAKTD